ncbi:GNAT family N-acetyltransferase [Curvibacter sp. APW13]|uniref:GNAT family N-acetyltransferase n=1 Tax=Curvibacter sp. APW13 TaxID=3077236 RepID=UPI0028DF2C62|nr:GNAT family N-acetyltransferase [Curvibacter sp. APW13]MDT8992758.1 GNAT family N-acetyltransferase [Curvibacter sp. APW13]
MPERNLYQAMMHGGWARLDARTHPRAYQDAAGTRYGTLEKDGVRIALSLNRCLGIERGVVMVYQSDQEPPEAVLMALIVDPERRKAGRATAALQELIAAADTCQTTLYLEPVPIEDRPLPALALEGLYRKFGFTTLGDSCSVMIRAAVFQTSSNSNEHIYQ